MAKDKVNVIIKHKKESIEVEAAHGNWKVVYADFSTAMMAFFMLLWILNGTKEEQLTGISDYFEKSDQLRPTQSGAGNIFGGITFNEAGKIKITHHTSALDYQYSDKRKVQTSQQGKGLDDSKSTGSPNVLVASTQVAKKFDIGQELSEASENLPIELKNFIQAVEVRDNKNSQDVSIVNRAAGPYFFPDSDVLTDNANQLLTLVANAIKGTTNKLLISAWADGTTMLDQSQELSVRRALVIRRHLEKRGVDASQFQAITGKGMWREEDNEFHVGGKQDISLIILIRVSSDGIEEAQLPRPPSILKD